MNLKAITCVPATREILRRADQLLLMRMENRRPKRGEGLDLFERILMRMNEEDAVVLRKRLSANEQAQLSILDLHQKLDQIQTRYHL